MGRDSFERQFSYEQHDILEIVLFSFFVYLAILPLVLVRIYKSLHYFYVILLLYISIELLNRLLLLVHVIVYSYNGNGIFSFEYFSLILDSISEILIIFLLILLSKGYSISVLNLKYFKKTFFYIFLFLSVLFIISHAISVIQFDTLFHTTSYDTLFGFFELCMRIMYMVWFFHELKTTYDFPKPTKLSSPVDKTSHDVHAELIDNTSSTIQAGTVVAHCNKYSQKRINTSTTNLNELRSFYLHFCACSLVWFIYLPILVSILKFVTELFRFRLMLSK
jgi:hypothetical protein